MAESVEADPVDILVDDGRGSEDLVEGGEAAASWVGASTHGQAPQSYQHEAKLDNSIQKYVL